MFLVGLVIQFGSLIIILGSCFLQGVLISYMITGNSIMRLCSAIATFFNMATIFTFSLVFLFILKQEIIEIREQKRLDKLFKEEYDG